MREIDAWFVLLRAIERALALLIIDALSRLLGVPGPYIAQGGDEECDA